MLAWDSASGRVLLIECKDVQYRKTFGEVAEQLSDFRGEIKASGRRDYLRKHLDRVQLASDNLSIVAGYVGVNKINVESHIVFQNSVPMKFALDHLRALVSVHTFAELAGLTPRNIVA